MGIFGGPGADKILAKGTLHRGTIVGIDVRYVTDDNDSTVRDDRYAVQLDSGATIGMRQTLVPDDVVRFGMGVSVKVLGDAGCIDWIATGAEHGFDGTNSVHRFKVLKDPPTAGIVDRTDTSASTRKRGEPVTVAITGIDERSYLGGMINTISLTVTVSLTGDEPYEGEVKRVQLPFYASHLCTVGRELPGFVKLRRLDKPAIDWPAAAMAHPGIGEPPALSPPELEEGSGASAGQDVVDALAKVPRFGEKLQALVGGTGPAPEVTTGANGPVVDGIDLATYVGVQVGLQQDRVPPADYERYASERGIPFGTWAATEAAWQRAMVGDWRIGSAFGEAFEAERKARKRRR